MAIKVGFRQIVSKSYKAIATKLINFRSEISRIFDKSDLTMKKNSLYLALILVMLFSCKKQEQAPVGPTDIRVQNMSDVQMNELTVNTYDSTYNYGTVNAGATTGYHRFDRAYSKANITAIINGLKYKTDTAIFTYGNYLSTIKATYQIRIEDAALRKLKINVIPESSLK